MEIIILDKNRFIDRVLPKVDDNGNAFFISILDPEEDSKNPFRDNNENYKTWWFFDLEEDIGNYKSVTTDQAKEIFEFIKVNKNKEKLFVHCSAGISRSAAIGAFVNEYTGGKYNDLLDKFPHILPNGKLTHLLRLFESIDRIGIDYKF